VHYWEVVRGAGHSDAEIMEELEAMESGEGWVCFNDLPGQYERHAMRHNQH